MFANNNFPSAEAYRTAISELQSNLTEVHLTIFRTQYSSHGRAVTSQQLRDALGYRGIAASNAAYGTLGKLLGNQLGFIIEDKSDNRPGWWRALATGDGAGAHFTWIMRPQLASALERLGIVAPENDGLIDAPDVDLPQAQSSAAIEGRKFLVRHFRRERNRGLVAAKKAESESKCEICGFSSLAFFGRDYCEAHHLKPLAQLNAESETTLDDLAIVCACCHRIIHSQYPPLSIENVRAMINENGQDKRMECKG